MFFSVYLMRDVFLYDPSLCMIYDLKKSLFNPFATEGTLFCWTVAI